MTKILPKYVAGLKGKEKEAQIKSIKEGKDRPKTSVKTKKSKWTKLAHAYFDGTPTLKDIQKALNLKSTKGLKEIIKKGEGAYYSSGSRPNTSAVQWGYARLYAVIFGSEGVRKIDKDIIEKYGIGILPSKKLKGGGFWDWAKRQYRRARDLFDAPKDFNNVSRKTLNNFGNCPIQQLTILRTPIQEVLGVALNALSFGKWYNLMKKYGYDKMFHLSLVAVVNCDGKITPVIIEKNEVVNVSQQIKISADSEFMEVPLRNRKIPLDTLVNKTRVMMGDKRFFDYDAFKNNCQVFINSVLDANDLLTDKEHTFLFQPLDKLHSELDGHISPIAKGITRLGSIVSRLRGDGKVRDILKTKKYPLNYSNEVEKTIDAMSLGGKVEILGSMRFKSQLYTSDYDCFEVVKVNSLDQLKNRFQKVIKKLKSMKNTYIGDIKLGSIDEWKIIDESAYIDNSGKIRGYNVKESREKLDKLKEENIINNKEYEDAKKLLIEKPNYEELKMIIKNLRFNVVRWKPKEVLQGFKNVRGQKITLEEAFKSKSLFKLDVISLMDETYTELTMIYDIRLKGKRLNYFGVNTKQTLLNDIHLYNHIGNWFKLLKRLFSYYNYILKYEKGDKKKYYDKLEKVINILNSDVGILYTITQDIEVILFLLDNGITPRKEIMVEIDNFIKKMGKVYNINIEEHYFNDIKNIQKLKTKKALIKKLEKIQNDFTAKLNKYTKEKIDESNLL